MGFNLEIVTPDELIVSEEANKIVCPGAAGEFGVLPGHVPLMTKLAAGELRYVDTATTTERYLVVTGGFVEVTLDKVTVLADGCIRSRDIDGVKAELDLSKAEDIMKRVERDSEEYIKAKKDYDFCKILLKVKNKLQ